MYKYLLAVFLCSTLGAKTLIPTEDPTPGKWFLDSIEYTKNKMEKVYREKLDKLDTQPERARCAQLHNQILDEHFVSNRIEEEAIEKALNWNKGDFTWHNNKFYTRAGCTSWVITPEFSSTGTSILQKNRDYKNQNLLSVRLFRAAPGRHKVITVCDLWSSGAGAAMNEKGLMIVQNDPSSREYHARKVNTGSVTVMRYIAEHCSTLEEAADTLRKFYVSGACRSGSIYLLADFNRGLIVEATPRHVAEAWVNFACEVRANNFLLPGMTSYSKRTRTAHLNGANRRFLASDFIYNTVKEKGKISPADLMKLARLRDAEMEKSGLRQVCMKNTLCSTMFVPDRMYPEYLSVTYVALGPPRHTIFLPIPMGLPGLPQSLADSRWGTRALELSEKLSIDHKFVGEFEKIEEKFISEFTETKEKARLLLLKGKHNEALQLLSDTFCRQYKEAGKLLTVIEKKAAGCQNK